MNKELKMNFIILTVKVSPQSKKLSHQVMADGSLKVFLKSPPEKGKANKELLEYLASLLNFSVKNIEILTGETNKIKRIKIFTNDLDGLHEKIGILGKQLKL